MGEVVSAEGLCRWFDKDAGFVSPDDFISMAESNWLIFPLGECMLKRLCRAQKELKSVGISNIKLTLNLSAKQLANPNLADSLLAILIEENASADLITLEITETALGNSDSSTINLNKLRAAGFSIALDDFGRGYSSLEKLNDYNFDVVKLDKVFIDDIPNSDKAKIVCNAMIDMAIQLGFSVVAEGIETQQQMLYFSANNHVSQQGFYHAKPMKFEQFKEFVINNRKFSDSNVV